MFRTSLKGSAAAVAVLALIGCSGDGAFTGTNLATSSIDSSQSGKVSPACVALVSKIDSLRKDGITSRVEKASVGKSKTVSVYRTSLAQMAELDKANAEFQQKCSTLTPSSAIQAATTGQAPAKTSDDTVKAPVKTVAETAQSSAPSGTASSAPASTPAASETPQTTPAAPATEAPTGNP